MDVVPTAVTKCLRLRRNDVMRKTYKAIAGLLGFFILGTITGEPKIINREEEAKSFPALQETEKRLDANITEAYNRVAIFGPLVEKAKIDRLNAAKQIEDPQNFQYADRFMKFTPRNTYIRFVSEDAPVSTSKPQEKDPFLFILAGLGEKGEIQAKLDAKVKQAQAAGVKAVAPTFAGRDGIELTQFEFIYDEDDPERRAAGSRRKSLALYFKPGTDEKWTLEMVVTRVVEDNMLAGVRDVEVIIDPSPMTPETDDLIFFHRYNQKPVNVAIVGTMSNTPNNPLRNQFKQKFYSKLLDHFFRLYRLVDGYANKDSNDYNREVIEKMKKSMEY